MILRAWSWLNPLGCHTEALPTSRSIGLSSGGMGADGGMIGGGDSTGHRGGGRGGVQDGVRPEEAVGWSVSRGEGAVWIGESGGGRDVGGGLEERGMRGLDIGGRGGGREGGVEGGGWVDLDAGGGGLGRHGRAGGREEGMAGGEGSEDGEMEATGGVAGVSAAPVRGLVWLQTNKQTNKQEEEGSEREKDAEDVILSELCFRNKHMRTRAVVKLQTHLCMSSVMNKNELKTLQFI